MNNQRAQLKELIDTGFLENVSLKFINGNIFVNYFENVLTYCDKEIITTFKKHISVGCYHLFEERFIVDDFSKHFDNNVFNEDSRCCSALIFVKFMAKFYLILDL
jgi:hypothetical protein